MKYVWSASRRTTCRLCSTMHTVRPCSRTASIRSSIVSTHFVSMPARARRAAARAPRHGTRASETSFVCPYDSAPVGTSTNSAMPTNVSHSIAAGRVACSAALHLTRVRRPSLAKFSPGWCCTAIITFCTHDRRPNRRTSWKERTRPMHTTSGRFSPTSSTPLSLTEPRSGWMELRQQVEHGRLAGTVRTDEGGDGSLAELDVEVLGGQGSPKLLPTPLVSSTTGASSHFW